MDVKEIIRKKKSGMPTDWQTLIQAMFREFIAKKEDELLEEMGKKVKEAAQSLGEKIAKEVRAEVLSRMPTPQDGRTPTEGELLGLIRPLIPKARNGRDADETEIADKILRSLPRPIDGKSPTKKALKELIKPLLEETEERLRKTLNGAIRGIQRTSRPSVKGGGMGNIVTQSTAVSSATTTIALTNSVASNGKAIWFNYQGQQQAYGTHFTVSGKTITLLFTPADDTYADIIYIRK